MINVMIMLTKVYKVISRAFLIKRDKFFQFCDDR